MKPWSNPKWVTKTPIVTAFLLEGANLHQLWQMWHEHSSLGQSPWGWLQVNLAMWLWLNFYRVMTPDAKWAMRMTFLGICVNTLVILSTLFFKVQS